MARQLSRNDLKDQSVDPMAQAQFVGVLRGYEGIALQAAFRRAFGASRALSSSALRPPVRRAHDARQVPMSIAWRPVTVRELDICLQMSSGCLGDQSIGKEAALATWKLLHADPAVVCAVLEADPPFEGHRFVGFGASAFVRSAFLDDELTQPKPHLNSRIIDSVHNGNSVLLTRNEIATANASAGLDVVILYGTAIDEAKTSVEVQTQSAASFVESHAGYRLRRIVLETCRDWEDAVTRQTGIYEVVADFTECGRALHMTCRDKAESLVGSVARMAFLYRKPTLRLRESEQELLIAALGGSTDSELAVRLRLSLSGVKARWRAIFDRVAQSRPGLIRVEASERSIGDSARGAQKRHSVLTYVRAHPEELRPFAWDDNSSTDEASPHTTHMRPRLPRIRRARQSVGRASAAADKRRN